MLLFDPQTSGGLLASVDERRYLNYSSTQKADPLFWKIGEIISEKQIEIIQV
jgi:selenophosphate synthase